MMTILLAPPLAAASIGTTAAIAAGTIQAIHAPTAPAISAPATPSTITLTANRTPPAYNPFALLLSRLPACREEDGSGSRLPCRWNAQTQGNHQGISYIVIRDGGRNRKTHIQKVIYIYRDHIERGTI